jgi:RNA polymerase sigma-70 factor (ECF subfamily)
MLLTRQTLVEEGPRRVEHDLITAEPAAMRDEDLMRLVVQRDERALGVLYDRYIRLVYAVSLRITGDRETAEEVVQDVFQAIWQSAAGYRPGGASVSSWMMGITRHRAIDATRSKRERARSRERALDPGLPTGDDASPETEAGRSALRDAVREALGTLPATQRQAVELAYYGGLTRDEIAKATGEPLGTVKTRLRLGLLKLRDLLHPHAEP